MWQTFKLVLISAAERAVFSYISLTALTFATRFTTTNPGALPWICIRLCGPQRAIYNYSGVLMLIKIKTIVTTSWTEYRAIIQYRFCVEQPQSVYVIWCFRFSCCNNIGWGLCRSANMFPQCRDRFMLKKNAIFMLTVMLLVSVWASVHDHQDEKFMFTRSTASLLQGRFIFISTFLCCRFVVLGQKGDYFWTGESLDRL